jgi:hypothetical protein
VLVERRLPVGHPPLVGNETKELSPQVGGDGHDASVVRPIPIAPFGSRRSDRAVTG